MRERTDNILWQAKIRKATLIYMVESGESHTRVREWMSIYAYIHT